MRALILATGLALLAGCTTATDLKSGSPVFSGNTKKSSKQYALCVFPKWQDLNSGTSMSETETGYRLLMGSPATGQADELLEITDASTGASVKHFQRIAWQQLGRAAVSDAVKSCL
ncbi:hypothetical protein D3C77_659280 [compost metagenome]